MSEPQEQDLQKEYKQSDAARYVVMWTTAALSMLIIAAVSHAYKVNELLTGLTFTFGIMMIASCCATLTDTVAAHKQYLHQNLIGFNAIYWTDESGKENVEYTKRTRTKHILSLLKDASGLALVVPFGGWFSRPRIVGLSLHVEQKFRGPFTISKDKKFCGFIWLQDRDGARVPCSPWHAIRLIYRANSRGWSSLVTGMLMEIDSFRATEHQHKQILTIIDNTIARIDSGDRLPFTKEGQQLRDRLVQFRLNTLPKDDARRAALEAPPRRRKKTNSKAKIRT